MRDGLIDNVGQLRLQSVHTPIAIRTVEAVFVLTNLQHSVLPKTRKLEAIPQLQNNHINGMPCARLEVIP